MGNIFVTWQREFQMIIIRIGMTDWLNVHVANDYNFIRWEKEIGAAGQAHDGTTYSCNKSWCHYYRAMASPKSACLLWATNHHSSGSPNKAIANCTDAQSLTYLFTLACRFNIQDLCLPAFILHCRSCLNWIWECA